LTDKRIIANKGLLQVTGIEVTQSIAGRLVNYGTVIVAVGDKKESFHNIAQAVKIKEQISSAISKQG
jgi:hypothetical protein